jgi:hypothetical protein
MPRLTLREVMAMPPAVRDSILQQIRAPLPADAAEAKAPSDPYRSKLEREFAAHLELCRKTGERVGQLEPITTYWLFEPVRLKIAMGKKPAWYTPDFMAFDPGSIGDEYQITLYEVKGFWREAARVRIKVAAGVYPMFRFVAVTRKDGQWLYEGF